MAGNNPPIWVYSKSNFIFPKSNFTIQQNIIREREREKIGL